jgi:hypothetical protein
MIKEDIIRMAREAGWTQYSLLHPVELQRLERFASLVAALEQAAPPQISHAEGCWSWGPAHYACACAEIAKLKGWSNGR